MRTTSALKTAALVIAAVVLALGTVQGSLAVWNTTTRASAGTINSADFAVTLTSESGAVQRLTTNGQPATVALPAMTGLKPGGTLTIPVTVTNATDAGSGSFRIRVTASAPTVTGPTAAKLTATAGLSATSTCPTSIPPVSAQLAQGASATLCVKVSLEDKLPATFSGQENKISVNLQASQL